MLAWRKKECEEEHILLGNKSYMDDRGLVVRHPPLLSKIE